MSDRTLGVLADIEAERLNQDRKWGLQNHRDGTGIMGDAARADEAKRLNDLWAPSDQNTWRDILHEEVLEAFAEKDEKTLREELVQCAAVCVAWVEALDRRR